MESRSTFVTVLAWVFIVGAGFAVVISVAQVMLVLSMGDEAFLPMQGADLGMANVMSQNFHFFIYGFFVLTLFTLVSSIALLKRKKWARLAFIIILTLGILWQIGGAILQFTMFSDVSADPRLDGLEDFERITNMIRWFTVGIGIVISGLFAWVITRLVSPKIVAEFSPGLCNG